MIQAVIKKASHQSRTAGSQPLLNEQKSIEPIQQQSMTMTMTMTSHHDKIVANECRSQVSKQK